MHLRKQKTVTGSPFSISLIAQVFGWDPAGTIEFNEAVCSYNFAAAQGGGCFCGQGKGIINTGAKMRGNAADTGGCICESSR